MTHEENIAAASSTSSGVFADENEILTESLASSSENLNDYYAIDYIQLEKGNRPTDYYPAPEDLTDCRYMPVEQ